jgi:hypothetical protein
MAFLNVLFEVPAFVREGLGGGSMIRRGGVIQWAAGSRKGEVVAWLRESQGLREHLRGSVSLPQGAAAQYAQLGIGMTTVIGVQIFTLAVVAIGFAIINQKLKALDRKLDVVLSELRHLSEEVAWLDRRNDLALLAKVSAALETAAWSQATSRPEQLPSARAALLEAGHHYAALLQAMVHAERAYRHPDLYSAYLTMFALVGVGRAQVDALLDGPDAGSHALIEVVHTINQEREAFQRPMREFSANLRKLVLLGPGAEAPIREAVGHMHEAEDRVSAYETEFAFCATHKLSLADWNDLGKDESTPRLLLITPTVPGG